MRRSDPSGDLLLVPPDKNKHIHAHKLRASQLKALICHGNRVFGFVLLSWWFGHTSCRKWISVGKLSQKYDEINNLLHLSHARNT
jgi:hypothetical protein